MARMILMTILLGASLAASPFCRADEFSAKLEGQIQEKPIVISYARNINASRVISYVSGLSERLKIGESMRAMMTHESTQQELEKTAPRVAESMYGFAMYLVSGLTPSYEIVSFQQVVDEDDARRLVEARKGQWGIGGTVTELGNGCFRVQMQSPGSSYPLPSNVDEEQLQNQNPSQRRGQNIRKKIVEKEGVKHVQETIVIQHLFRYQDSILYEANFEDFFEMSLPSSDAISSAVTGEKDLGVHAYLDRIPMGMRQLGWNMLSSAVGTQLQQRDDEPQSSYEMRKSSGDLALAIIQAVLFDIDNSDGWARFANAEDDSLRAELRIRTRNNSALTKQLQEAAGNSRFAPILSDNAAATLHACVRLPKETSAALQATGVWLTEAMQQNFASDPKMASVSTALAGVLHGIGEHRTLELLVKAGWTESSGGVFYGGMQLSDEPDLLQNLHHLLTHLPDSDPQIEKMISLEELDGLPVIKIMVPPEGTEEFREALGIQLTHIYLAHQNSCLWFATGTENSYQIIRHSVSQCTENARAARTPLASGRIDMERWLSYPQDDPARIAQLPFWLDENARWFPPFPSGMGFSEVQTKPTPIMQSVFDLGGSKQAGFSIEADESGILIQTSLGEALANHMLARFIDNQQAQMEVSTQQIQQPEAQQKEALEEAQKKLPPPP